MISRLTYVRSRTGWNVYRGAQCLGTVRRTPVADADTRPREWFATTMDNVQAHNFASRNEAGEWLADMEKGSGHILTPR